MSDDAIRMIDYHAARAVEELQCAKAGWDESSRYAHLELSALHLRRAAALCADYRKPKLTVVRADREPVAQSFVA